MCASLPRLFLAPIWVSNFSAGPFITAGLNQQVGAESSDKLYCIRVYVILFTFSLSDHYYNKVKCQNAMVDGSDHFWDYM